MEPISILIDSFVLDKGSTLASVHELKHAAKLQEWSAKVAECRGSGSGVKAWCAEHGISPKTYYSWERQIVKEATEKYALPAPGRIAGFP